MHHNATAEQSRMADRLVFVQASPPVDWQRALKGVFKEAGIPHGHAPRFRDRFAVGLLQAGVPMDRVSVSLGHSSIKVTEKHYSPWVRARQDQPEAQVGQARKHPWVSSKTTVSVSRASR
jgi:integrase